MANEAKQFGIKSIFRSGGVQVIVPDKGAEIIVRAHRGFRPGEVIIKDGNNKRRTVALSAIKSLEVNLPLAETVINKVTRSVAAKTDSIKSAEVAA